MPEIGGLFLFGDQAVISHESLKNLKVNNLGSFINYKYKIIEKENVKGLSENLSQKKISPLNHLKILVKIWKR